MYLCVFRQIPRAQVVKPLNFLVVPPKNTSIMYVPLSNSGSAVKTIIPPALIVMMSWVVFWMDKAA